MDKNFVNIDDLVRQRLGGGEEQEQVGSWGRMNALLDKEMPQKKRPAGMYWRRSLSAVALLLLVTSVSVGGYMMANNKHTAPAPTGGDVAVTTTNSTTGSTAANNTTVNNTTDTKQKSTTADTNNNTTADKDNTTGNKKQEHRSATPSTAATKDNAATHYAANSNTVKHLHTVAAPFSGSTDGARTPVAATAAPKHNKVAGKNNDELAAAKPNPAVANKAVATHRRTAVQPTANAVAADKNNTTGSNSEHTPAADNETMSSLALGSAAPSADANTSVKHAIGATHKKALHNAIAANTSNSTDHKTKTTAAVAANEPSTEAADNSADEQATETHKSSKRIAATTGITGSRHKHATTAAKQMPVTAMPLAATAGNSTGTATSKMATSTKPAHKAQKQVQTMVLSQRMVRISPTEVKFVFDTISVQDAMEEYELVSAPVYGPQTYEKYMNSMDESSTAVVAKDNHVKKLKGTSSMENLSAAFNDMKTKVKGAHFGGGLTAGINGTFFGPNSFKGFQFGATGAVTFSQTLTVMGELKYFHRINNDYTLSDNYYTYTPTAGGYTKTLVNNPYSFSTLHSIELPISVRYCTGNFNFFAGANIEYSFAINTGAYPLADPSTTTQVATVGSDNKPKIQNDDFSSRFGLGYLVGASYQVSPNVMIDFRSVQNVWDNSKTDGAKMISSQLYRSPSLQLSIGYKLGGKPERNK